jgi:hypothetical protein
MNQYSGISNHQPMLERLAADPINLETKPDKSKLANRSLEPRYVELEAMYKEELPPATIPNYVQVLYKNRLIYFQPSVYLSDPLQIWKLNTIAGSQKFDEALFESRSINESFIEKLLDKLPFVLYLSDDKYYLIDDDNEVTRADFGCLTQISVEEAARRFGVAAVEEALEKTFVRV